MRITLIRVGDYDSPARPQDIEDFKKEILKFMENPGDIVTHHAVEVCEVCPPEGYKVVWKIGDYDAYATPEDLKAFEKELEEAKKDKRPVVWHHAVRFDYIRR